MLAGVRTIPVHGPIQNLVNRLQQRATSAIEVMDESRAQVEASAERAVKAGRPLPRERFSTCRNCAHTMMKLYFLR